MYVPDVLPLDITISLELFGTTPQDQLLASFHKLLVAPVQVFVAEIVTEIVPTAIFYEAEKYHQNYFNQNGNQPYCQFVIRPKVEKFQKAFKNKLK